jgi:uncharacterized protein (UPF0333 family)
MEYSSGLRLRGENDETEEEESERPKKKAKGTHNNNNKPTRVSKEECKCGQRDHKRTSSSKCPWQKLSPGEVSENYARRMEKIVREQSCQATAIEPTGNTVAVVVEEVTEEGEMRTNVNGNVHLTSTLVRGKNDTVGAKNDTVGAKNGAKVQSISKLVGAKNKNCTATSNHM